MGFSLAHINPGLNKVYKDVNFYLNGGLKQNSCNLEHLYDSKVYCCTEVRKHVSFIKRNKVILVIILRVHKGDW